MKKMIVFDWGRTLYDSENATLFTETLPVLQYLHTKYKLAIVSIATDGDFERRLIILKNEGIDKLFSMILFSLNDKDSLYFHLLTSMQLMACEVVVVDDRIIRGIKWGNKHGAMTVWIRRGKFMNEIPDSETGIPTYTISSLVDLYNIL